MSTIAAQEIAVALLIAAWRIAEDPERRDWRAALEGLVEDVIDDPSGNGVADVPERVLDAITSGDLPMMHNEDTRTLVQAAIVISRPYFAGVGLQVNDVTDVGVAAIKYVIARAGTFCGVAPTAEQIVGTGLGMLADLAAGRAVEPALPHIDPTPRFERVVEPGE